MIKCPYCFQPIPDDYFAWRLQSGEKTPDHEASRYAGYDVTSTQVLMQQRPADAARSWQPNPHAVDPHLRTPVDEVCPRCHYALPAGWRSATVTCIAMNGARATGKSLYIAVVVKQLEQLALRMQTTLSFANDTTRDVYTRVYEQPLFAERGLMPPTPRADTEGSYQREPLIFSLGMLGGIRRFVVFRDVAGEEMENPPTPAHHLGFLAHADGIIFLMDPLAVPSVRERLVDLIPAQLRSGGDPVVVLGNLLRLIGGWTPRLAITLSKFDALQELRKVDDVEWRSIMSNSGASFLREPEADPVTYDENDGQLLHEETKSLLHKLHAAPIVVSLANPSSGRPIPYRFFTVSALGESPDGNALNTRGIAPFRCLDPVKWLLNAQGILK